MLLYTHREIDFGLLLNAFQMIPWKKILEKIYPDFFFLKLNPKQSIFEGLNPLKLPVVRWVFKQFLNCFRKVWWFRKDK